MAAILNYKALTARLLISGVPCKMIPLMEDSGGRGGGCTVTPLGPWTTHFVDSLYRFCSSTIYLDRLFIMDRIGCPLIRISLKTFAVKNRRYNKLDIKGE